jgi:hypothetical protein
MKRILIPALCLPAGCTHPGPTPQEVAITEAAQLCGNKTGMGTENADVAAFQSCKAEIYPQLFQTYMQAENQRRERMAAALSALSSRPLLSTSTPVQPVPPVILGPRSKTNCTAMGNMMNCNTY